MKEDEGNTTPEFEFEKELAQLRNEIVHRSSSLHPDIKFDLLVALNKTRTAVHGQAKFNKEARAAFLAAAQSIEDYVSSAEASDQAGNDNDYGSTPKIQYLLRFFVVDGELDIAVEDFLFKHEDNLKMYGSSMSKFYLIRDLAVFIVRTLYKATPIAKLIDAKIKQVSGDQ